MEIKKHIHTVLIAATLAAPAVVYKMADAQAKGDQSPPSNLALLSAVQPTLSPTPESNPAPTTPQPPEIVKLHPELLPKFIAAEAKMADPARPFEDTGLRISDPWEAPDKRVHLTFQRVDLVLDPQSGEIRPDTLLEKMHADGLDKRLANGQLGVVVPEKKDLNDGATSLPQATKIREDAFGIQPYFRDYLNNLKPEVGVPTSPVMDSGPFQTLRLQGAAIQYWKDTGRFQYVLVGDAAAKAGLIPKEALLAQPVEDTEILKMINPQESLQELIAWAAPLMGITPRELNSLTTCESGNNPNNMSPNGLFFGLTQLDAKKEAIFRAHGWQMFGLPGQEGWRDPKKQLAVVIDLVHYAKSFRDWPNCGRGIHPNLALLFPR